MEFGKKKETKNKPLVSIIIPMYNAEKFIIDTLNSVVNQTFNNWECIIVDDGSIDNSFKIVSRFCRSDKRFNYFKQSNAGPSSARNKGFALSKGEYIQYLDADDVLASDRFEILLDEYQRTEPRIILYSNLLVVDNGDINSTSKFASNTGIGKDLDFKSMYKHFYYDLIFIPGCILFPRAALKNIVWNENLINSEDWDYYLQITKNNHFKFRNVKKVLFYYRNTTDSLSKNLEEVYKSNYQILENYRSWNNILNYSRQFGLFMFRNFLNYRNKRISYIVNPFNFRNSKSLFSFILLPLSLIFSLNILFSKRNK